jgi:hypothetical protein
VDFDLNYLTLILKCAEKLDLQADSVAKEQFQLKCKPDLYF